MILRKGDQNSDVYNLERVLSGLGFAGLQIDNTFDQKTENVVKYVQQAHGLDPDGIVGPKTFALIDRLYEPSKVNFTSSGVIGYEDRRKAENNPGSSSNSKLAGVHPKLAGKAENILSFARRDGFTMVITQGLRTFAQQNALYAKGRTTRGPRVTNAPGGRSYHNYGIAVDFAFVVGGKISWDERLYRNIGKWADEAGGLTWGGRWKFVDLPHVQLAGCPSTSALLADYKRFGGGNAAIQKIWAKYIK